MGHDFEVIREEGLQAGAVGSQGVPQVGGKGGEVRVDGLAYSAAFISKPSSILSDGATG